jgi:hypothetical protein
MIRRCCGGLRSCLGWSPTLFFGFGFHCGRAPIKAENLFLRRQLALYIERGAKPRRIDLVTRIGLTLLSRCFNWRDALVVVQHQTLIRWHRAGWKLVWRLKSRPGRPPIPTELRALIRRIANELLLKIGIRVSPRTVNKYLPRRPQGRAEMRFALVDLPTAARAGDHCLRFLPGHYRDLSSTVCVCGHGALQPAPDPLQRHRPSKCRLDSAAAARGRRIRRAILIPASRSTAFLPNTSMSR